MSQRLNLFNAGFCAASPSYYFSGLKLAAEHENHEVQAVRDHMGKLRDLLNKEEQVHSSNIRIAEEVATQLELTLPPGPKQAEEYFNWLGSFVETFENAFPMSKIDHYYFLFGRKLAEISSNIKFALCCIKTDKALGNLLNLGRKTDKCLKDNEFILFKLIAPAALLSSEPRHLFFNRHYKDLSSSWDPFRTVDPLSIQKGKDDELISALTAYDLKVDSCYKDCITHLTELGV